MKKKTMIIIGVIAMLLIVAVPYTKKHISEMLQERVEQMQKPLNLLVGEVNKIDLKDTKLLTLEKKGEAWGEVDKEDLKYDQQLIDVMIKSIKTLESREIVKNATDIQKYGINEEARKITIYNEEGKSQSFTVGDYTSDKTGCYIWQDEEEILYIVDSEKISSLLIKQGGFIGTQMMLPEQKQINILQVKVPNQKEITFRKNSEMKNEELEAWQLEDYFMQAHDVHLESVKTLLKELSSFEKVEFIDTLDKKADYGLVSPTLSLIVNENWEIHFGKRVDDLIYFNYSEEPYIYAMKESAIKLFMQLKPIEMIKEQVYSPQLDQIKTITLTNPQEKIVLSVVKNEIKSDEIFTEGAVQESKAEPNKVGEEQTKDKENIPVNENYYTSTLNDKVLDAMQTREIIDLISDSVRIKLLLKNPSIEQKEERKAEVTIAYELEGGETKLIELIPYDINFYILRLDGTIEFAVNKQPVMALFNSLSDLIKEQ